MVGGAGTYGGALSRAVAPSCLKEPTKVVWASNTDASLWRFSKHNQLGEDPGAENRTHWRDYEFHMPWGRLEITQVEIGYKVLLWKRTSGESHKA